MATKGKIIGWTPAIILIVLAGFIYVKFCFVYSEGINEGDINYFQKEGFIFKTYEGKMIQTGYNSKNSNATIQSNEFKFSVADDAVAEEIDTRSGRQIKLHWKRYLGTLPWRGNSQFIVDKVIPVENTSKPQTEDNLLDLPVQ